MFRVLKNCGFEASLITLLLDNADVQTVFSRWILWISCWVLLLVLDNGPQMYTRVSVLIPATTVVHMHLSLLDCLFPKYISDCQNYGFQNWNLSQTHEPMKQFELQQFCLNLMTSGSMIQARKQGNQVQWLWTAQVYAEKATTKRFVWIHPLVSSQQNSVLGLNFSSTFLSIWTQDFSGLLLLRVSYRFCCAH